CAANPPLLRPLPTRRSSDLITFRGNTYLPGTPDAATWPDAPIRTDCEPVAGAAGVSVQDNVFARSPPPNECGRYTATPFAAAWRSEEHTSELQSPDHLVCRL